VNEWRDFSRLPDKPDYWQELGKRISRNTQLVPQTPARREWWPNIALATSALAAAALIVLLLMQPVSAPAESSLQAGLAPADPVAHELLNSQTPPHISGLLPAYAPRAP
jgi:ferric-dicitrate binding protein FerR (iron transport regulator)